MKERLEVYHYCLGLAIANEDLNTVRDICHALAAETVLEPKKEVKIDRPKRKRNPHRGSAADAVI